MLRRQKILQAALLTWHLELNHAFAAVAAIAATTTAVAASFAVVIAFVVADCAYCTQATLFFQRRLGIFKIFGVEEAIKIMMMMMNKMFKLEEEEEEINF